MLQQRSGDTPALPAVTDSNGELAMSQPAYWIPVYRMGGNEPAALSFGIIGTEQSPPTTTVRTGAMPMLAILFSYPLNHGLRLSGQHGRR
jgi:hypothetical protein